MSNNQYNEATHIYFNKSNQKTDDTAKACNDSNHCKAVGADVETGNQVLNERSQADSVDASTDSIYNATSELLCNDIGKPTESSESVVDIENADRTADVGRDELPLLGFSVTLFGRNSARIDEGGGRKEGEERDQEAGGDLEHVSDD